MGILASQAARELGISSRTLGIWATQGKVRFQRSAGGWRLYDQRDIEQLKRKIERRRG